MRNPISILALMILLSSCTASRQAGSQPESKTLVRVENRNFLDMKVYILRGSERIRIGTVTGNSKDVFVVPDGLVLGVSSLRFFADPIGGSQTPVSQDISIQPGEEIELIIQ
ncbi:MAG: hypothetical protein ACREOO_02370 [bacterium]